MDDAGNSALCSDLIEATELSLDAMGTEVLLQPQLFVSALLDKYDGDDFTEIAALVRKGNTELFTPFAEAALDPNCTARTIQSAARIVASLMEQGGIASKQANLLAGKLMAGISRHLGLLSQGEQSDSDGTDQGRAKPAGYQATSQSEKRYEPEGSDQSRFQPPQMESAGETLASPTDSTEGEEAKPPKRPPMAILVSVILLLLAIVFFAAGRHTPNSNLSITLQEQDGYANVDTQVESRLDGSVILPEPSIDHEGYAFGGWAPEGGNGEADIRQPGEKADADTYRVYNAVWYPTISFDGNGANSGTMDSVVITQDHDDFYTMPESEFAKNGYVFAGWQDANGEEDVLYHPGEEVYIYEPTSYIAIWKPRLVIGKAVIQDLGTTAGNIEGWDPAMDAIVLLVTNETGREVDLSAELSVLSSSGNKLDTETSSVDYLASGDSAVVYMWTYWNKQDSTAAFSVEAEEVDSSWSSSLHGCLKQEIIQQDKSELVLKLTNTSDTNLYVGSVSVVAVDNQGNNYVGDEYPSIDLKPGESGEIAFTESSLVGLSEERGPDWQSLDCTFYIEGYSQS